MDKEHTCEDCWQFEEPKYSERPGKCFLKIYDTPYKDTSVCDQFDNRYEDEE
jgi:hypothetical protein